MIRNSSKSSIPQCMWVLYIAREKEWPTKYPPGLQFSACIIWASLESFCSSICLYWEKEPMIVWWLSYVFSVLLTDLLPTAYSVHIYLCICYWKYVSYNIFWSWLQPTPTPFRAFLPPHLPISTPFLLLSLQETKIAGHGAWLKGFNMPSEIPLGNTNFSFASRCQLEVGVTKLKR